MEDALTAGAANYGYRYFLVRQVGDGDMKVSIPALTLGVILSADPSHTYGRPGPGA